MAQAKASGWRVSDMLFAGAVGGGRPPRGSRPRKPASVANGSATAATSTRSSARCGRSPGGQASTSLPTSAGRYRGRRPAQ